ncbi:MAG: hypothetical protein ABEJ65_03010 [bacterium]
MENTTQLKLTHKLTDAITTLLEESECLEPEDSFRSQSGSLGLVLSVEAVCCQYIRNNERNLNSATSPGCRQLVSELAFQIFLLLSTDMSFEVDPTLLIPKLKQVIRATLLPYLP